MEELRLRTRLCAAIGLLSVPLLIGCATSTLSEAARAQVCRIDVAIKVPEAAHSPNPLSSGSGWLTGAGVGALGGLQGGLLGVPVGMLLGFGYGAACAVASAQHPSAEADFERILRSADLRALLRTLQVELNAPRPECLRALVESPADSKPDAVVEIEKIEARMACLIGNQAYWFTVQWRAVSAKDGSVLAAATTRCELTSSRGVDAWFADPDYARAEAERLLVKVGEKVALDLFEGTHYYPCAYRSRQDGELEER